jgi:hypothetical protein
MALGAKTKYNYTKFMEDGGSIKKHMTATDLHFILNTCPSDLRLKCFDYSGRLVWSATAALNPESKKCEIEHDLGCPHLVHASPLGDYLENFCLYCADIDRSFGGFKERDLGVETSPIRFLEKGTRPDAVPSRLSQYDVVYYDLDAFDFVQFVSFVEGGRRCFLTPHYQNKQRSV